MAIQGLENKSLIEIRAKHNSKIRVKKKALKDQISTTGSILTPKTQPSEQNRSDLLSAIRSKIKRGFYNSDAVLDDLSYGFAEALDQAV